MNEQSLNFFRMAQVELVHSQSTYPVSVVHLIAKCDLFKNNPCLTIPAYHVQSEVSREDFQDFLSALEGKSININDQNFPGLLQLSEEFGCQVFLTNISNRRRLPGLPDAQRVKYLSRISSLEQQVGQHEHELAVLQLVLFAAVRRFESALLRLGSELKVVHEAKHSDSPCPGAVAVPQSTPAKSQPAAVPAVPAELARNH
jgi:hypothetical protein